MDSVLPAGGGGPGPGPGPGYPESTDSSSLSGGGSLWDEPSPSSAAAAGDRRMRLMCSFGGRIVPRPTDKSLCYLGGETRIVTVNRNTTLADVHARLSRSLLGGRPFTLKYQLPNKDLDFLISVSTDEDLDNLIDQYDRIAASSSAGGSTRPSRIRLFLFPVKPESSSSLGSSNSKNSFVEALNSAISGSLDNIPRRISTDSPSVNRLLGLEDDDSTHSREGVANSGPEADQRANQQKPPKPEVPPVANPTNSRRRGKNTVLDEARSPCFRVVTLVDVSEAEAAGKMEASTSASLGAMGSLLRKLDVLLASGCRLPETVKDGMHLLKDDLEEISACLQDLSEVEDPPLTAKCWMKEVRELSYDIEDYIDKFVRPVRANIKTRFVCKISHVKITRLPKRLKWHQQIVNMIPEFRIYVQEAIERHERYELHCCTFRRRFVSVGPMLPTPYEETAELVIDGWMNKFINSLANDGDQQLKVVSIVGPECLGKTTLAKMLYNKFGGQFDCRAFIRVSQKPDMKWLFCDMLSQVQRQRPPDDCKELDLIDNIRKYLQDKRYLIIIDDLWAASVWDIVNRAFPEGSRRSRIITTTQIEDVALTCCCYHSEYVFEMKPLDDDHSRKLFFNRLFGSESDCPQQFKQISNKTVEICGGLPLATVHIASLLESQPVILLDLWMYVCDSLSSDLRTNSTSERMRQVLNLSFNNLPHHLKTCLLYLNMYPEGHTIFKDDLVKQWVAEGFIDRIEGRDMEKVAGSYFDELIDRRFIQPIDINYNDEVLSCTVHDVVHDLIAYKSVEENFIVVVDYYRKNVEISDKVRRLSVCFGNAKYAKTPANIRTSQVRSLTFFGLFKCMPSITEFKLLRVLNLQLSGHHDDDTLDLTGISELFQLRYLKIACNICIELPNHMRGLQYLETLDMDTKVTAVPWDIIHIPRLLHLRLPVETNLLDWIGSMRSVSDRSLGNLTNLRDLYLTCSTPPSDHLERNMEALGSLLRVLGNLKTLALVPGSSHKNVAVRNASKVIVSWDNLAPPLLQRFDWLPQSCMFSRVPKWIGELGNLCILKIAVRELLRNGVAILKGLPALTALSLHVQTAPVERIVFDKAGFSVLKYFKFKCSVPWLKFEADAMPNLRKLMLGFNALGADQHGTARISIEHLPGLKEISAKIGGAGSDADSALAITVSSDPRNPRINMQGRSMVSKEKKYGTLEEQDEILQEDPDKHYGTKDGESGDDENKQARSMARQEQEHGTLVDQDKIMEDDPDEDSGEDENKLTGRRISTLPESSSHLPVPASNMVRKKRSGPGSSGESSGEASGASGQGSSQQAERAPQQLGGGPPQQHGGGRGWVPRQGGRGGGQHQGRGGHYQGRGGPHHPGGGPPEYQPREYQGRGGPHPRGGGMPQPYYGEHRGGCGGRNVPPRPSRTVPELHQAPHVQYAAPVVSPSPSGAGSSSQPAAEVSSGQVQQQFLQLAIHGQSSTGQAIQLAPPSSKSVRFPLRPGKGTYGDRCIVKANHFFAELPDKDLHQYDVSITPEVTSRGVNRAVMGELVTLYRQSHLGGRLPVYDGRKSLYTAGPLPFTSRTFELTLQDEEDSLGSGQGGQWRERPFRVVIKFAARADLHHLAMFLAGRQADAPQEALQVLDIVLRELPTARYSPVGRSFYSPNLGRRQHLGEGLESWRGFYQSIRPTQMGLSLNIDMSSTAFIESLPVIDFVAQLLNRDISVRPLSDSDRVKIKKALRGVKVEVTHRGNMRRKYRISGLTSQATRELSFPVDDRGTVKTVVQYFLETYGFSIQHTTLPCLQVGNQQRPNYLPMEVCKIVEGQRYSKRLNEKQITALLKVTCQRPQERELDILQTVHHNAYYEDPYAQEFGIRIDERLASVEARVLPPPRLKYHDSGREKDVLPRIGQWNMMNKKMVNGGRVSNWACINFSRNVQDSAARGFCHELAIMCQVSGMNFALEPVLPPVTARPEHVERALKARYQEAMNILRPQGRELDLLIVILPDNNGSLYGDLKRICETDLGLVSQCCLTKHVFKMSKQYLANVALKINVKVGGRNTVLVDALTRRIPLVSDRPTIIFGADVTHPHPGEDSSPSIAAVVASQDWPEVTKYAGLVSAQAHRQELIQDLFKVWQDPQRGTVTGGMIKELLISFKRATGQKPQRIIFYRDGVSEGQFYQVLLYELDAIRKACASLEPNYQPPVTFVVVQKRHHTRLFANNHNDQRTVDRSGNILPGTVVDSKICHPTEFDFYLCSHAGIQGTSRPAHYHVLWDENKFTADELQTLTNNLCYTYARCTRSVSIVPPAYYAHLAAFRARFYMEPETSDSGSMVSGTATSRGPPPPGVRSARAAGNVAVRPLPALKENVKRVMFYC